MKMGDVVKNAPNSLIWAVTVAFLGVLAAFVVLAVTGSDAEQLWVFIGRLLNALGAIFGAGGLVIAGAAAKSAANAERQTNGEMPVKIAEGVRQALGGQVFAACGQPYPCEHAPDGGNHPAG